MGQFGAGAKGGSDTRGRLWAGQCAGRGLAWTASSLPGDPGLQCLCPLSLPPTWPSVPTPAGPITHATLQGGPGHPGQTLGFTVPGAPASHTERPWPCPSLSFPSRAQDPRDWPLPSGRGDPSASLAPSEPPPSSETQSSSWRSRNHHGSCSPTSWPPSGLPGSPTPRPFPIFTLEVAPAARSPCPCPRGGWRSAEVGSAARFHHRLRLQRRSRSDLPGSVPRAPVMKTRLAEGGARGALRGPH